MAIKVLVTGAAGFVGSHVAEYCASQGYDTYGIDNLCDYYNVALKHMNVQEIKQKGVTFITADLTEDFTTQLPTDLDYIFHFAAQPGIAAKTPLNLYVRNNIFATQQLVEWAVRCNTKLQCFVNIATSSIYGKTATLPEDALPQPISFYGVTKLAAEQLVLGEQRLGKLCACSLRLYSVYGPRERPEKLYTRLISAIYKKQSFSLYRGSQKHSRSFTYVDDIVRGVTAVMGKEQHINGEIINMGSDKAYTTGEGIALIEKITGQKVSIAITAPRPGDQLRTTAVIGKASALLGYTPSTSFETGLRAQVAWYKTHFL